MNVKEFLLDNAQDIDNFLTAHFTKKTFPEFLEKAMAYSLLGGGKRIRAILCLVWGELLGAPRDILMPVAAGIECIHTYSLIHDDLPAMDDDDMRRGKPSSHKKFGEANAILAGDGLLTEAFMLMTLSKAKPDFVLKAIQEISKASGPAGMVGGQVLDMEMTNKIGVPLAELQEMQSLKTGALILVSCLAGAILAGGTKQDLDRAVEYGSKIGLAFQVVDDILDIVGDEKTLGKPVGSDEAANKTTYPSLIGLEKSLEFAQKTIAEAVEVLNCYEGKSKDFLVELAHFIVNRAY